MKEWWKEVWCFFLINCKNGNTSPGVVNTILQQNGCTIIFKDVPADVCTNCGEYYLNEEVTNEILLRSEMR